MDSQLELDPPAAATTPAWFAPATPTRAPGLKVQTATRPGPYADTDAERYARHAIALREPITIRGAAAALTGARDVDAARPP